MSSSKASMQDGGGGVVTGGKSADSSNVPVMLPKSSNGDALTRKIPGTRGKSSCR